MRAAVRGSRLASSAGAVRAGRAWLDNDPEVGIAVSLARTAVRVLIGLAIGLLIALPAALLADARFVRSVGLVSVALGLVSILMTFGGSSPARRMGLQNAYLASLYPRLARSLGEQYSRTTLSDSAIFFLTGACLLAIGLWLIET